MKERRAGKVDEKHRQQVIAMKVSCGKRGNERAARGKSRWSEIGTDTSEIFVLVNDWRKYFIVFFQTTEMANADLDKYYKALDRYVLIFLFLCGNLQYFGQGSQHGVELSIHFFASLWVQSATFLPLFGSICFQPLLYKVCSKKVVVFQFHLIWDRWPQLYISVVHYLGFTFRLL